MQYREAKTSRLNEPMTLKEQHQFCHELAVLQKYAVCLNRGQVVENESENSMFAMAYFMGWKWRQNLLVEVFEGQGYPEKEFADFVHKAAIVLNIVPFVPEKSDKNEEFEIAMAGRCSFTRSTDGKYAFAAQIAFEAWCKALERKIAHDKT
jgi:hypothetical protein